MTYSYFGYDAEWSDETMQAFDRDAAEIEYLSSLPDLEILLEDESKRKPSFISRYHGICPSCKGDGLYKRHTSYRVNGKPICFRCNGSGKV